MEKTKIVIFHDYFRVLGGAEKLVLLLARNLKADIITSEYNKEKFDKIGFSDVKIIPLGERTRYSSLLPTVCRKRFSECNFQKSYDKFIFSGSFSIYAAKKHKPSYWYCHTHLKGLYEK